MDRASIVPRGANAESTTVGSVLNSSLNHLRRSGRTETQVDDVSVMLLRENIDCIGNIGAARAAVCRRKYPSDQEFTPGRDACIVPRLRRARSNRPANM